MPKKTLTILRHAKAETGSALQDDAERRLIERGEQAAIAMGNTMARRQYTYDLVLCSPAQRTRQTLEHLHLQPLPPVEYNDRLYLASANEILHVLSQLDEQAKRVLIIGHNPGLHQLCLKLAGDGDEMLLDNLVLKFPTCALAVIELDESWRQVSHARGTLLEFLTPKALVMREEE